MRRLHDDVLKTSSKEAKLNKMKIQQEKNAEARGEMWIEAMNYIEQYSSSRCWKSHEQAIKEYNKLDSKSKRLKSIKEQISICRKGFGLKMDIPSHQARAM
jgi:tryptophanase